MTGMIGCSPGSTSKPSPVIRLRKNSVFSRSRSRSSAEPFSRSSTASEAATTAGATELENRYGRERWRSSSTISARPLTYPPLAPPSALPRVPVTMSTRSATPASSGVPRPSAPTKPTACESSTITSASCCCASAQIPASGA